MTHGIFNLKKRRGTTRKNPAAAPPPYRTAISRKSLFKHNKQEPQKPGVLVVVVSVYFCGSNTLPSVSPLDITTSLIIITALPPVNPQQQQEFFPQHDDYLRERRPFLMRMPLEPPTIKSSVAMSPDREHISTTGSSNTSRLGSPTSVVDDAGPHTTTTGGDDESSLNTNLPSLEDIQIELHQIVKRSANSKASYHSKLTKITNEIRESTTVIQILQDELEVAKKKREKEQQLLLAAKQKREIEAEQIVIRKLNLEILKFCMEVDDDDTTNDVLHLLGRYITQKGSPTTSGGKRGGLFSFMDSSSSSSSEELVRTGGTTITTQLSETRSRLEEIHQLFTTAQMKLKSSNTNSTLQEQEQQQGRNLQNAAIQLYMEYKANQK